jgi:hypothetical protein
MLLLLLGAVSTLPVRVILMLRLSATSVLLVSGE